MAHLFLVEGGHCQWSVVELGSEEGESALHSEGVARSMTGAEVLGGEGEGRGEGRGGEGRGGRGEGRGGEGRGGEGREY